MRGSSRNCLFVLAGILAQAKTERRAQVTDGHFELANK
jgi:hypothetical protein